MITIDVDDLYKPTVQAKLDSLSQYESEALSRVPPGDDVTLTGPGPVWLYLRLAHVLHGRARKLTYDSPVTGPVVIFDHNPS